MADQRISQLTPITGANMADSDQLVIARSSTVQNFSVTRSELFSSVSAMSLTGDLTIADKIVHSGDTDTSIRFPAADTVTVETAGSERLRIASSGNVGIGTNNPAERLHIAGGGIRVAGATTESRYIEIGTGRTGNGLAYIDLVGDATYTDYGLRIIRGSDGANADSAIIHRGTGQLNLQTREAAPIVFSTTNAERVRITSAGNVGIGTNNPGQLLHVNGTALVSTALRTPAIVDDSGGNTATINGITPALASQAEAEAGTDNTKLMTPLRVAQAIAPDYTSSEVTAAANTTVTFAHGLGSVPTKVEAVLRCATADGAFAVGDVIYLGTYTNFWYSRGSTIFANSTNCRVSFGTGMYLASPAGSGVTDLTLSRWRLTVRAWK